MIRFTKVSKHYPTGTAPALDDVTFHVARGEFVFLTGHSGAGKSSLLKLMYGDEQPSSGDVRVSGFHIGALKRDEVPRLRRRLGIVFQDFGLLEDRTASENVAFALEVTGTRADVIPARVTKVLAQVGLLHKAESFPRELSGGEQQRVAVARALFMKPDVILADEPTGNLDGKTGQQVIDLLFGLQRRHGATLVLITHDASLAALCGRTVRMADGQIADDTAATGPPKSRVAAP